MAVTIAGEAKAIEATPSLPFFVKLARGETSSGDEDTEPKWIEAGEMKSGDRVMLESGKWVRVLGVGALEPGEWVYNFTVDDNHTYFVGNNGTLVHNISVKGKSCSEIKIVKRPKMAEETQYTPNGEATKIYGQAENASSTTRGHGNMMREIVKKAVSSGKYSYLTLQRSWRTATGYLSKSRSMPDVIGVRRNGKVDAWEVESATDDPIILRQRLEEGRKSLPKQNRGQIKVVKPKD